MVNRLYTLLNKLYIIINTFYILVNNLYTVYLPKKKVFLLIILKMDMKLNGHLKVGCFCMIVTATTRVTNV